MRLRLGRPRTALVVAPHPDDETIGAYGLMARLIAGGSRVRVLIVSDGAASHAASAGWPRTRLVAERARESRRALGRLGVRAGAVTMLRLPDGALSAARHGEAVRRAIRHVRRLDLLVGPVADDAHPDHRAVAAMIEGAARHARQLRYQVWPDRARPSRTISLPLGPRRAAKRRAVLGYRTQTGLIRDDPRGFAMSRREVARFAGPVEHFREPRR